MGVQEVKVPSFIIFRQMFDKNKLTICQSDKTKGGSVKPIGFCFQGVIFRTKAYSD